MAVCIPTKDRPDRVRALLSNLGEQKRQPEIILVVDASASGATKDVCEELGHTFEPGVLRYERCEPGLPLQRLRGIQILRDNATFRYVCFLDDDVLLGPEYLHLIVDFMESDQGAVYAGVCGYDLENWGKPVERVETLYRRMRLFDEPIAPGRWFYCGHFFELDHLTDGSDVHESDYLPGFQAVWRSEVFDEFLPPADLAGYALGEDKHLSLRIRTKHRLAVYLPAGLRHLHATGGRPDRMRLAFQRVRSNARFVRECDPHPSIRRYAACVAFHCLEALVQVCVRVSKGRFGDVGQSFASLAGALTCIAAPPRRTRYALDRQR